ncbi:MAG: response regulator [Candidatus Omnitrophica bacterium]|nr:response regulator [Candidatus Omnitrophota bacterium]
MSQKEEFVAMFRAEAAEYVVSLEKGLVDLEKSPGNLEIAKELNRVAHTLKGAARVFGFKAIQDITHRIENIFEKVYNKQLDFSSLMTDRALKGIDLIKIILEKVARGETPDMDVSAVCQSLDECQTALGQAAAAAPVVSAPPAVHQEPVVSEVKAPAPVKVSPVAPPPDREPAGAKKPETDAARNAVSTEEYVRVPLSRVNKLLNLIGEMVINKMNSSAKISRAKKMGVLSKDLQTALSVLDEALKKGPTHREEAQKLLSRCSAQAQKLKEVSVDLWESFTVEAFHLNPVIDELQSNMKELRMLPVATIFEGLPRMARDIARERGKEVNLEIAGAETELDKKVLEGLKSPLMHILRNAVDHGIELPGQRTAAGKPEAGTIRLSAFHEAGAVVIKIEDDGKGIDVEQIKKSAVKKNLVTPEELGKMSEKEIINLIFMNGFSTSPIITDISGRGIGLDIVRRDIEALKGKVMLDSVSGQGTTFTLILPLTIAIIQVLLVKTRDLLFALPVTSIIESLSVDPADVVTMEGRMAVSVRGHTLPLARLSETLVLPAPTAEEEEKRAKAESKLSVVIVSSLDKKVGFIVDEIIGEEEVFIKGLGAHLGKVKNVSGATVLWTGAVVVVLDVEDLLLNSCLGHPAAMSTRNRAGGVRKASGKRILVCDDAFSTRELVKNLIESVGYVVDTAVDGLDGWERLARNKYDLVVSDVEMPRMTGFELCEQIKKSPEHNEIPVVLCTALDREEHKKRGIDVGASAYIVKTAFDQSTLLDSIKRLIG